MKILKFLPKIPYGSNTYVVENAGIGILVDPSVSISDIGDKLEGVKIKYIVITHAHFDHFLTLEEWQTKTNATVFTGALDIPSLSDSFFNCYRPFLGIDKGYHGEVKPLNEGDVIYLGKEKICVIHTPGHTKGAIALISSVGVIVGDTVFAEGGIGRTDLPGGNYGELLNSIAKIKSLPTGTTIYPGHGRETSV